MTPLMASDEDDDDDDNVDDDVNDDVDDDGGSGKSLMDHSVVTTHSGEVAKTGDVWRTRARPQGLNRMSLGNCILNGSESVGQ